MSILISGIEMPKENEEIIIRIDSNGTIMTEYGLSISGTKAIPIPSHGRLIDANTLREKFPRPQDWMSIAQALVHITGIWAEIDNAPTVIEEEVYGQYTDTAGNFHWCGTKSGEHTIKA